jgi:hypothetical protein
VDIGIKLEELSEPRRKPMHPDPGRRRHPQIAVRPLAAVGEFCARCFELHEHVVRSVMKQLALFSEDESACVTMEQRYAELLLQC